jgi:hypothetical protein
VDSLNDSWLAPEEYQVLKKQVREEADALKPKGYGLLLKNGFDETQPTQTQRQLDALAQLPGEHYPRGSEVYLSRQHREERDEIHERLVKAVLKRQRTLKTKDMPKDVVAEKLRNVSKKHSRSSRLFARRLGLADQRAVQEGDDVIKALNIVKDLRSGNAKMVRRKSSIEMDLSKLASEGKHNGPQSFGLAYMAGHRNHSGSSKVNQSFPVKPTRISLDSSNHSTHRDPNKTCLSVLQSALDLLDLGDDVVGDEGFSPVPSTTRRVAMSA